MARLAGHARAVAAERVTEWPELVNVSHEMRALVNDVMTRFFGGGNPLGTMPGEMTADQSARVFARLERRLEFRIVDPLDVRARVARLLGLRDPFRDAALAEHMLRNRLACPAARSHAHSEPGQVLARNLTADEAGREMMTLLAAGATSGHHLAWTCAMLAEHGDAQRAARSEALAPGPAHTFVSDVAQEDRRWITAALNETLRLFPPAPLMFRMRRAPREYIVIAVWAMHRHPSFWKEPTAFDPGRWIDGQAATSPAFIPFGFGPRVCIGRRFAQVMSREALSEILRRRDLAPGPHPPRRPRTQIMTRPHADIFVHARRRGGG
jgi:cytochrome P450